MNLGTSRRRAADRARTEAPSVPLAVVQPTRYVVSCFPPDSEEGGHFNLAVEYRGRGLWAVVRLGQCLSRTGTWDYESIPSERTDEWLADHRFDLDTALKLAKEAAPLVTVNGFTVTDALRMQEARS